MTDSTMRSLLDVHRTELNERDATIESLKRDVANHKSYYEREQREAGDLRRKVTKLEERVQVLRSDVAENDARVDKLQQANESLNSLLTSERSAFSAYRDTHPDVASAVPEDGDGK